VSRSDPVAGVQRARSRARWRAHLIARGFPADVPLTEGRPDRPSRSPEAMQERRRRWRLRRKAERLGISYGEAEAMTPRQPGQGHHGPRARGADGRFISAAEAAQGEAVARRREATRRRLGEHGEPEDSTPFVWGT